MSVIKFPWLFRLGLLLMLLWSACSPKYSEQVIFPLQMRDITLNDGSSSWRNECCTDPMSYIPDPQYPVHTQMHRIRVNFHFMHDEAGKYNIPEAKAEKFAMSLFWACNERLADMQAPYLPPGNDMGKTPTFYRLVLTGNGGSGDKGIYHHYDDSLYYYVAYGRNRNNYERDVIDKYGIGTDTVLNVFIMPHHPDSIASPTYKNTRVGITLGRHVKIAGVLSPDDEGWQYQALTNHEIGHVLGLQHTWSYNDGCDDTPRHPNCWNRDSGGGCDTMASNNLMDYNAWQNALSPCQVGLVHRNLAREHMAIRKLLIPEWCVRDTAKTIYIRDSVNWKGSKDLQGDIVIEEGGRLRIRCRVSMPAGSSIRVQPGGKLYLDKARIHNSCGGQWLGIIAEKLGKKEGQVFKLGEVKIEDATGDLNSLPNP